MPSELGSGRHGESDAWAEAPDSGGRKAPEGRAPRLSGWKSCFCLESLLHSGQMVIRPREGPVFIPDAGMPARSRPEILALKEGLQAWCSGCGAGAHGGHL